MVDQILVLLSLSNRLEEGCYIHVMETIYPNSTKRRNRENPAKASPREGMNPPRSSSKELGPVFSHFSAPRNITLLPAISVFYTEKLNQSAKCTSWGSESFVLLAKGLLIALLFI